MSSSNHQSKQKYQSQSQVQQLFQDQSQHPPIHNINPQYLKFFANQGQHFIPSINIQELNKQQISYNPNHFQRNLNIVILDKSENSQVMRLAISLSYFLIQITVLNCLDKSNSNKFRLLGYGAFSKVYLCQLNTQEPFTIKSISYSLKNDQVNSDHQKTLRNSIMQFCFCKLFSVLKIGPKVITTFGFDLIIFNNTIQFSMEVCKKLQFTQLQPLISDLYLMHSLGIVHGDIKPENIMFSKDYNKNIFVDFGMTCVLKEKPGQLTLTSFFGTYSYCCPDMKRTLAQNSMGYVDLYYNDTFALSKVMQTKTFVQNIQHHIQQLQYIDPTQFFNFHIQSIFYSQNQKEFYRFSSSHQNFIILDQTIELFNQLQKTPSRQRLLQKIKFKYPFNQGKQFSLNDKLHNISREKRIKQFGDGFEGTVNDIMLFMMLYYKVDITPRASQRKRILKKQIQSCNPQNQQFWDDLIQFVNNPYASISEVKDLFESIKLKLKISDWSNGNKYQLDLYFMAKDIAISAAVNFQVYLFQLQYLFVDKHKMLTSKYESFNFSNYPNFPYIQFVKCFEDKFDHDFYHHRMSYNQKKLFFDSTIEHIKQKYCIDKLPYPIILFEKAIQVQSSISYSNYDQINDFLNCFQFFQPAKRTSILAQIKLPKVLCEVESLDYQYRLNTLRPFINTPSFLFNSDIATLVYFQYHYHKKWNLKSINTYFEVDLAKILDDLTLIYCPTDVAAQYLTNILMLIQNVFNQYLEMKKEWSCTIINIVQKIYKEYIVKTDNFNLYLLLGYVNHDLQYDKQNRINIRSIVLSKIQEKSCQLGDFMIMKSINYILLPPHKLSDPEIRLMCFDCFKKIMQNLIKTSHSEVTKTKQFMNFCLLYLNYSVREEQVETSQSLEIFSFLSKVILQSKSIFITYISWFDTFIQDISYFFYSSKSDPSFFKFCLDFLQMINSFQHQSFYSYFYFRSLTYGCFHAFVHDQKINFHQKCCQIISFFKLTKQQDPIKFNNYLANGIVIIEVIFTCYFLYNISNFPKQTFLDIFKMACSFLNGSQHYSKAQFVYSIQFWIIELQEKFAFQSKTRNKRIKQLKAMRSPFFNFSIPTIKFKCGYENEFIANKMKKITQIKMKQCCQSSRLLYNLSTMQLFLANRQLPHDIIFKK